MTCPTCQQPLHKQVHDNQEVFHCHNCGASFFGRNCINRITAASAQTLFSDKKLTINPPAQPSCPRDTIFMVPMQGESVPAHVRLYRCPECLGIFGSAEDVLNFKKAQEAKINYFKIWQIPLPALRSVVVFSFIALIAVSAVLTTSKLGSRSLTNTQATDILSGITVSRSNQYLFVAFKTSFPLKSKIMFVEQPSGTAQTRVISAGFTRIHQMVTDDLDLSKRYLYKIELTDEKGNSISTELKPLEYSGGR